MPVSAKRSQQQQQLHSEALDAWRGPGDFSEDLVKSANRTYKHLGNRFSGRRNSKCKGPEANCVLLIFYVCKLVLPFENGDHHYKTIYLSVSNPQSSTSSYLFYMTNNTERDIHI